MLPHEPFDGPLKKAPLIAERGFGLHRKVSSAPSWTRTMNLLIKRNQACCEIPRKLASSTYKNSAFCQDFHPIPDLNTDWAKSTRRPRYAFDAKRTASIILQSLPCNPTLLGSHNSVGYTPDEFALRLARKRSAPAP